MLLLELFSYHRALLSENIGESTDYITNDVAEFNNYLIRRWEELKQSGKKRKTKKTQHLEAESELFNELQFDAEGRVLMFRKMIVDPSFIADLLNGEVHDLGFHWATRKDMAIAYSGGSLAGKVELVMCVSVEFSNLNWDISVDRVRFEESEIIPFTETPLRLVSIWVNERSVNLPNNLGNFVP